MDEETIIIYKCIVLFFNVKINVTLIERAKGYHCSLRKISGPEVSPLLPRELVKKKKKRKID